MARKTGSHSDITGPKVAEAAARLIARHGFAAVSMRQIAAEVGVQAGTLYNYTPDKQILLFDLMRDHMRELLLAVDDAVVQGPAVAQLEAFTRFHISHHLPRADLVFISYMELRNLAPDNFTAIETLRHSYEDRLERILQAGVASGDFRVADTRITALALIALLTGLINWYRDGGRLNVAAISDLYWDIVRKIVI